ncbi:hypothetical protein RHOFW510R12_14795 [Rhodanobacter sp. FW510-R12]|uniref:hypothetical protein n=1 Tax=Rhodanobacter TaxID=75309 RepID=UPI0004844581|nr:MULTISPECIES: hypothetical protein [Rhodanobacter]UJJ53395.1 hypothetical protein LRK53_10335 [Rhodanobacter thiooxydans]
MNTANIRRKTTRSTNEEAFWHLIELAVHLLNERPPNSATTYAVRELVRKATEKAAKLPLTSGPYTRYISDAGAQTVKTGAVPVKDHIVPIAYVIDLCTRYLPPSVEELAERVKFCRATAVISTEEDQALRKAGLVKCMPDDWDGVNPLARYEKVGIIVRPIRESES